MKRIITVASLLFSLAAANASLYISEHKVDGHRYVDLGLPSGTLWATTNIGATNPEDYGNYYAWGETEQQADTAYTWASYKYANGTDKTLTKYCNNSSYGKDGYTDTKTALDSAENIVIAQWGNGWTMPTKEQFEELKSNCYWVWTDNYNGTGKAGYMVHEAVVSKDKGILVPKGSSPYTSLYDGGCTHIFLPAAGYCLYGMYVGSGEMAVYWSSELDTDEPSSAWCMVMYTNTASVSGGIRAFAPSIRAVISKTEAANANAEPVYKDGEEEGHGYVDLGLTSGTMWATANIGARNAQNIGDYYAWGETAPQTDSTYNWASYKYSNGAYDKLTKYCNSGSYGHKDDITTLEAADDAAAVNWGGSWMMPTKAQITELLKECYCVWTDNYNSSKVSGFMFYKAKSAADKGVKVYSGSTPSDAYSLTDAYIFLPMTGDYYNGRLENKSNELASGYWSNALYSSGTTLAWTLNIKSSSAEVSEGSRASGMPIRPVFVPKNVAKTYKDGTENGRDYVDLGLTSGTLWATTNVGGTNPEDYGNYYAWGETAQQLDDAYTWSSYMYADGAYNKITKYCTSTDFGTADGKTTLESMDDAAAANWGGKWVTPDTAQCNEIANECYWVWTSDYNTSKKAGFIVYKAKADEDKGVKVFSGSAPSDAYSLTDAHIFLPAAGYHKGGETLSAGSYGNYWQSSISTRSDLALSLYFGPGNQTNTFFNRYYGTPVRAVISKGKTTGIKNGTAEKKAEVKKVMRDGVIYIIKGDEVYGVNGNRVK